MPRQITCKVFCAKVMALMDWDPDYKYKILGKLICSNDQLLFVYDLSTPEIFIKEATKDEKKCYSRKPVYPGEWRNQFGLTDFKRTTYQSNQKLASQIASLRGTLERVEFRLKGVM